MYHKKQDCCGCGACAAACTQNAISMKPDREGFLYPTVEQELCISCGQCLTVCPIKYFNDQSTGCQFYGARSRDQQIRERSSSGGIFSVLADYVLKRSGYVYAAGFDKNMAVVHKEVHRVEDMDDVRRSKYVQSDLGMIFRSIRKKIQSGAWVLFTGTPCQTEALRLYLGQPYDRLILVDLICYGAASPGIWQSYIRCMESRHQKEINEYYFRDKRNRDNGHTVSWIGQNIEKAYPLSKDPYSQMYFSNLNIRPSCYRCAYCRPGRNSDFTLGDFWGLEKVRPDLDDGMGTSLVIVHTKKGERLWEILQSQCICFMCNEEDALQPRLCTPTERPWKRGLFMWAYNSLSIGIITRWIEVKNEFQERLRHGK